MEGTQADFVAFSEDLQKPRMPAGDWTDQEAVNDKGPGYQPEGEQFAEKAVSERLDSAAASKRNLMSTGVSIAPVFSSL
jgi:hypothetical protein